MPDIDVASLVGDIATSNLTLRTFGAATSDARGRLVQSQTDTALVATVHPASRKQLERLPSADRRRGTIAVYTTTSLWATDSRSPPHLLYAGRWYQLQDLGDYGFLGGIYLQLASLLDEVAA